MGPGLRDLPGGSDGRSRLPGSWRRPEARSVTNEPQSVGDAGDRGFAGGTSTIRREGRRCRFSGSGGYGHVLGYVRKRVPGLVIRPGRASPG